MMLEPEEGPAYVWDDGPVKDGRADSNGDCDNTVRLDGIGSQTAKDDVNRQKEPARKEAQNSGDGLAKSDVINTQVVMLAPKDDSDSPLQWFLTSLEGSVERDVLDILASGEDGTFEDDEISVTVDSLRSLGAVIAAELDARDKRIFDAITSARGGLPDIHIQTLQVEAGAITTGSGDEDASQEDGMIGTVAEGMIPAAENAYMSRTSDSEGTVDTKDSKEDASAKPARAGKGFAGSVAIGMCVAIVLFVCMLGAICLLTGSRPSDFIPLLGSIGL